MNSGYEKELIEKNMHPMTMEALNTEINQAMEDSKNGRIINARDLKAKIEQWG